MYRAPLTIRGPRDSRGAPWEDSGVSKAGSAGSLDVKVFDLGRSERETPLCPGPFPWVVDIFRAQWRR